MTSTTLGAELGETPLFIAFSGAKPEDKKPRQATSTRLIRFIYVDSSLGQGLVTAM
jgi:hypothetical protein